MHRLESNPNVDEPLVFPTVNILAEPVDVTLNAFAPPELLPTLR